MKLAFCLPDSTLTTITAAQSEGDMRNWASVEAARRHAHHKLSKTGHCAFLLSGVRSL
jgi:hypothetical protein